MKQTKRNSVWALAVFVALLGLSPSAEVASAQTKIAIASPGALSVTISIPLAIAQEQGLFAKYGLEIRVNVRVPPLVGKESELGFVGAPAALLQIAQQGTDLNILGAFSTGRISGHLVTRAEIKKPEDLRGKRFGVGAIGAANWISVVLALQHFGLDPKRDNISILSVGALPQIAKALEDGAIDAAMLNPAQSSQIKSRGFLVLLDMYPNNVYGGQTVLVTTGAYLQQHPDVVEKVVTALVEAMAFSLAPTNKPTVLKTIMKEFKLTDLAAGERGYENLRDLNRKPYPTVERLRSMQKVMALHEPKVLDLKVEDVIDDRFVRKLDQNGAIDRHYTTYGVK
jgi:ABC-type nitrate/sulfonate/bicarbonate transport system substrate-binding protein